MILKKVFLLGAAACGLVSFAGEITYTTTDMTAAGDWEVTVEEGSSNVVQVAQSGPGKIVKKGAGYLVFTQASTFTGGVEIEAGFVEAAASEALGTGTITIAGQTDSYTGYCELHVMGAGKDDETVISLPNAIHVTGNTTGTYPALVFFGQNSRVAGDIVADQDFCFYDDFNSTYAISSAMYTRYENVQSATFGGTLAIAGTLGYRGLTRYVFEKAVTAQVFNTTITRPVRTYDRDRSYPSQNNAHGAFVFKAPCAIGRVVIRNSPFYCAVDNVFAGTHFQWVDSWGTAGVIYARDYAGSVYYDQMLGGISSVEAANGRSTTDWYISGSSSKTLTLTGVAPEAGETTKELSACVRLRGKMNVTLDAYRGFTQTIRNWPSDMSQTLTAQKGTFRIAGTATFSNLTAVVVGAEGCFDCESTEPGALKSVKSITVAGAFTNATQAAFGAIDQLSLALTSGASFCVKDGGTLAIASLTVDGVRRSGTLTHADIPEIGEGLTIVALPAVGTAAVWTGAGSAQDAKVSNLANWQGTPAELDLVGGTLQASIGAAATDNGTEMIYEDGTFFYSLTNDIPLTAGADQVCRPFWIKPATPGATLTLYKGLKALRERGQLVLQGHFALPPQINPGSSSSSNPYTLYIDHLGYTSSTRPQGTIEGKLSSASSLCLPLVLAGATLDLPVYSYNRKNTQATTLLAYSNTVNVLNYEYYVAGYQSNCSAMEGSVLEFRNGVSGAACFRYLGPGEIRVVNKGFNQSAGCYTEHEVKLVLDAEGCYATGNSSREGFLHSSGSIEFRRTGCFNSNDLQFYMSSTSSKLIVEFNSTTQRVGVARFSNTNKGTYLQGTYPAMLEVTGQSRSGADESQIKVPLCDVPVKGGLGFHQCGEDKVFTLKNQAFASCGDLEASAGALVLKSAATWLNGTNFTMRGTGVIRLEGAQQVNPESAVFHFADDGKVVLSNDCRIARAEVLEDGVWKNVKVGKYSSATQTGLLAGHIEGTGVLRVGYAGLVVNIR